MTIQRFTRPLAGVALVLAVTAGALVAGTSPASAHPPSGSAPNYGHIDSDGISATYRDSSGNAAASVSGRVYWHSNRSAHFTITVRDLRNNGKDAAIMVQSRTGDFDWIRSYYYRSPGSYTFSGTVTRDGDIKELQFRVGQMGDYISLMAVDSNRAGYG